MAIKQLDRRTKVYKSLLKLVRDVDFNKDGSKVLYLKHSIIVELPSKAPILFSSEHYRQASLFLKTMG